MSNNPLFKFERPLRLAMGEQRMLTDTFATNATRASLWAEFGSKTDKNFDPVIPPTPTSSSTRPEAPISFTPSETSKPPSDALKVIRLLDEKDQADAEQQAYIDAITAQIEDIHNEPAA